jgi:hypothetical protein
MSLPAVIATLTQLLSDLGVTLQAFWIHNLNLTNRLCLRVYDIRRGEAAKICLCCFALHVIHPSPNGACRRCIFIAGLAYIFGIDFPVLSVTWHRES